MINLILLDVKISLFHFDLKVDKVIFQITREFLNLKTIFNHILKNNVKKNHLQ